MKTETKHTPGPWEFRLATKPDNTGGYDCAVIDSERKIIAECFQNVGRKDSGDGYETRPCYENASLIAAAPELLAAAEAALAEIIEREEVDLRLPEGSLAAELRAAIAKARDLYYRGMEKITRYVHKCLRCGGKWVSASQMPTCCGKCKSPYWDRPRKESK